MAILDTPDRIEKEKNLRRIRLNYGLLCAAAAAEIVIVVYKHGLTRPFSIATELVLLALTVLLVLAVKWPITTDETSGRMLRQRLWISMVLLWLPLWVHLLLAR
jgi:hypothetical protein